MPELRIILLVLGVLFVAAIAGFEWWRSRGHKPAAAMGSRGTARLDERAGARPDERASSHDESRDAPAEPAREPRSLPEINVVREQHVAVSDALPVIELASTSESGTRRALGIAISDEVAVDVSHDTQVASRDEPYIGTHDEISQVRVIEEAPPVRPPQLTLAWPPEKQRRIVTLRVIPRSEPRFPGRALRQAFSGCGFWHGPLDIYHLPDANGRVLLSAAALAQPGTFDPSIMDSQRFSGINLFAVLPGVLPEREVFEELVHAARQLAERLSGMIADQHGEELTAARITRLRQSLDGAPAAEASPEA
jgi:cell division protein ZipA